MCVRGRLGFPPALSVSSPARVRVFVPRLSFPGLPTFLAQAGAAPVGVFSQCRPWLWDPLSVVGCTWRSSSSGSHGDKRLPSLDFSLLKSHVSPRASRDPRCGIGLEPEWRVVVSLLTRVLGLELGSFGRAVHALSG